MTTPRDLAIPIQRITWRDGQELTSRDLRDSHLSAARHRQLHIRCMHKTWGVVEGLNVVALGSSLVGVTRGYALDRDGVELLVPVAVKVPAPLNSATMYLVISRNARSGCGCGGGDDPKPASIERAALTWKTVGEVRPGVDVLLARVLISGGTLSNAIDTSVQRRVASMAQPRMWSDTTQAGLTAWVDGNEADTANVSATVDTSDAGFVATPAYFAWLTGAGSTNQAYISEAGATSFTFILRQLGGTSFRWDAATANGQGWTIQWLAVELAPSSLLFPYES